MSIHAMSIRDLNLRPSEHESLPITTRPGLPPTQIKLFIGKKNTSVNEP